MSRNPVPWPGGARSAVAFTFDLDADSHFRLARIEELIEYMHEKGRVWFARLDEIAAHVDALAAAGEWTPRVDRMPCYPGPIPELGDAEPDLAR